MCVCFVHPTSNHLQTVVRMKGERVRCSGSIEAEREKGGDTVKPKYWEKQSFLSHTSIPERQIEHASYLLTVQWMILDGNGGDGQLEMGSSAGAPLGQGKNYVKKRK